VLKASNGAEALRLAHEENPDLITLDLSMPGQSGIEVFETLRQDVKTAEIPVCIITGKPEMRMLIYDRPVPPPEGYVDKPASDHDILLNVRKILRLAHHEN
jgi:CheY-like chemotaxis protein